MVVGEEMIFISKEILLGIVKKNPAYLGIYYFPQVDKYIPCFCGLALNIHQNV